MAADKEKTTEEGDRLQQIQNTYWSEDKQGRRKPNHPVVQAAFNPLADIVASSIDKSDDSRQAA